jgi:hypothetical protein
MNFTGRERRQMAGVRHWGGRSRGKGSKFGQASHFSPQNTEMTRENQKEIRALNRKNPGKAQKAQYKVGKNTEKSATSPQAKNTQLRVNICDLCRPKKWMKGTERSEEHGAKHGRGRRAIGPGAQKSLKKV